MMHKFISALILSLAMLLSACAEQKAPVLPPDKVNDNGSPVSQPNIFFNINSRHTWMMARSFSADLTMSAVTDSIHAFINYYGHPYRIADMSVKSGTVFLMTEIPVGVDSVYIVANGQRYYIPNGRSINLDKHPARTDNPSDWVNAPRLSWLLVCESNHQLDYDFNDLVASVTRLPDNHFEIRALAGGTGDPLWLHFVTPDDDYILSPGANNGAYETSVQVAGDVADITEWHRWFMSTSASISPVNTLATNGANGVKGAAVVVGPEIVGDYFSMAYPGDGQMVSDPTGDYHKPINGFYISVGTPDVYYPADGYTPGQMLISVPSRGTAPRLFVIPDISRYSTREIGPWLWPSEGSAITLTYPGFYEWSANPAYEWFLEIPRGDQQSATFSPSGECLTYGYYPRLEN